MHGSTLSARVLSSGVAVTVSGLPNVFRRPLSTKGEMLLCPSCFDPLIGTTRGDPEKVRILMAKLAARMRYDRKRFWPDRLSIDPAHDAYANPSMPAGYTYFLQLVSHDMTDSGVSLSIAGPDVVIGANSRARPLMLDTIYGGGPDVATHAYGVNSLVQTSDGLAPRTRLRLGKPRTGDVAPKKGTHCIFADLARAKPGQQVDGLIDEDPNALSEALIADPRNDSHALMSQMTVLFHRFHNAIMDGLEDLPCPDGMAEAEWQYRIFNCARLTTTFIYRRIVLKDLLPRLLHPCVVSAYGEGVAPIINTPETALSLEFARGAFRFGHAMVRDSYDVNGADESLETTDAIKLAARRNPERLPIGSAWIVDWSRFFAIGPHAPNLSNRIGSDYPDALEDETLFKAQDELSLDGLAHRDLMASAFAGLWSVPALIEEAHGRLVEQDKTDLAAKLLKPYNPTWREPIREWLLSAPDLGMRPPHTRMTAEAAALLADDPPLPFFVLFEAAHRIVDGKAVRFGMGRHLGPLGSLLVAEAIHGALVKTSFVSNEFAPDASVAVGAIMNAFLGQDPGLFGRAAPPETMPNLITFLAEHGAFA